MKIAVIGCPGSGKTSCAIILHKILKIPLYHLDQYYWKPNWQRPDRQEFEKVHNELCDEDEWIIEGVASRYFEYRFQQADIIIFLDIPLYLCYYRVFKRAFLNYKNIGPTSPKGCPEKIPDFEFLRYIWRFHSIVRPDILDLIEYYKNDKKVYIVKNDSQIQELLELFKKSH